MNEPSVPISKLGAYGLWAVTAVLLLVGWGVYSAQLTDMALMLATSACVTGLGATTLTIRCYAKRATQMILQGMSERRTGDGSVRSMRP